MLDHEYFISTQPVPVHTLYPTFPDISPEFWPLLVDAKPAETTNSQWRECLIWTYRFLIAPMAGVNGFVGGREAAETFCYVPSSLSWTCGIAGWLGFTSGFYGADFSKIDVAKNKAIAISSGIASFVGAIPSATLTAQSTQEIHSRTFSFIQDAAFQWIGFLFAGANGISNFVLGVDEAHKWSENFKKFFKRLFNSAVEGMPKLSSKEKAIMVFCGLVIAYCAFTSLVGYSPPIVSLVAKFAPQAFAEFAGVTTNVVEWMFETNMMFTQDPEQACCWNFASPLPKNWRANKTITALSVGVGLMTGLAMASYTFAAMSNPLLGSIFAATAWTGGFWSAVRPTHACLSDPCAIVKGIYTCCIAPCCYRTQALEDCVKDCSAPPVGNTITVQPAMSTPFPLKD